ncbi:MAG: hypothetical protein FWG90_06530 [Oscillospiraceae bacterium]|nr:hypothetical protein [Oscillospiraceae bacterium]
MANSTDLNIRVKSKLGTTQQVLLYQEAHTLNVKNFANSTDLKIRVKNKLGTTQQVLLYQEVHTLNVKNFKTAAWEHEKLLPGAQMQFTFPTENSVGSMENHERGRKIMTKLIPTDYNTAWDIYSKNDASDKKKSSEPSPK